MPKIIITIEDKPNGNVSIVSNPPFTSFVHTITSTIGGVKNLSQAEIMALYVLNRAHEEFARNKQKKQSPIIIPKFRHQRKE